MARPVSFPSSDSSGGRLTKLPGFCSFLIGRGIISRQIKHLNGANVLNEISHLATRWLAGGGAAGAGRAAGTFIVAFNVYRTNSLTCSSRRSRNFQRRLGTLQGSNKISHLAGAAVLTFSAAFANERDASAPGSTVSRRPARLLVPRARTTIRSLINGQTNCLCLLRGLPCPLLLETTDLTPSYFVRPCFETRERSPGSFRITLSS